MIIRPYEAGDLSAMIGIWNEVVLAGDAFPQENTLDLATASEFFSAQSLSAVAEYEESDGLNLKNRA
jgi:L-amino acid N-acyltransferase YncA